MLVYVSLWYLIKKGYLKSFYLLYGPEGTGYGYGGYYGYDEEDPCFYEPGTPDPCGGS